MKHWSPKCADWPVERNRRAGEGPEPLHIPTVGPPREMYDFFFKKNDHHYLSRCHRCHRCITLPPSPPLLPAPDPVCASRLLARSAPHRRHCCARLPTRSAPPGSWPGLRLTVATVAPGSWPGLRLPTPGPYYYYIL